MFVVTPVQRHRDGGCTRRLSHQSHHCHHSEACSATFAARLVFWGSLFAFVHLALVGFTVTAVVRSLGAAQGRPQISYNRPIGPAQLPYKVFLTTSNRHSGMVMPLAFTRHSVHGGGSHRASPSHARCQWSARVRVNVRQSQTADSVGNSTKND